MISCAALSEKGGRKINEDSILVRQSEKGGLLCVLADGLGGHGSGEVASALAVAAAQRVFEGEELPFDQLLPTCILEAQNDLINEQRRENRMEDIKTTVTLLHIKEDIAHWAHVGDSRIYRFSGHKLAQRTLDHSVPQMLVATGEIREKDIRFHEDRNRLIRVLGMEWDSPKYELSEELMLAPPQSFLMCSDGFWELIDEKEMSRSLKRSQSPEDWLQTMQATVVQNGQGKNMDNYSAIAVFVR